MSNNQLSKYKKAIASYLKVDDARVFLFWKGRVGLYAILKALGVREDDEVIIPAFTCVVVPNAIIYLGAKPVYVDIESSTYNIDIAQVEKAITSKTKVIIAQNTFGLSPNIDTLLALGQKYGIEVIEDCTHGMGGFYKNKANGTLLKASFFSTQWNKPFSTGIGGIAYINDASLAKKVQEIEANAEVPSLKDNITLSTLIWVRKNLITPQTYWLAVNTYRWLSEKNIITGSSQGDGLDRPIMPKGFLKGLSTAQARVGTKEIIHLDKYVTHQRKIAQEYDIFFAKLGVHIQKIDADYVHSYLKYPLLVKDRKGFIQRANEQKIELGEWFNSPIHPIEKDHQLWQYTWGSNPIAEKLSQHIINLPTGINIDNTYLTKIKAFILSEKDNLIILPIFLKG
jgi:dTDP-4-amino-4,6-dideoxygalactose transaminase